MSEDDANTLILRLIFIRYLIDRKVKIDQKFIKGKVEDVTKRRKSFSDLIADPKKLNELFDKLNVNFNGVLFKNNTIQLSQNQADSLSKVFKGEIPEKGTLFHGTDFYFEIFDFSIIPVEIISGIYESIINPETRNEQSAVYTPPFLVEYILNDTVDKFLTEKQTYKCKIFDPAVGSGIFLAQSLRKMIERYKQLTKVKSKKKFSEDIRDIATQNLFGIDINLQALKVACFSIYITLLDYQDPKDIDKYKFPDLLNENLFDANFFDTKHPFNKKIKNEKVDFILGNPPWKKDKSKQHLDWVNSKGIYQKKKNSLEISASFLLHTRDFMHSKTHAALIVTSTAFYNTYTYKGFKSNFLTSVCMDSFFDLSPARKLIFKEKKSPAVIVQYRLNHSNTHIDNIVKHSSIKPNVFLKRYRMLVFESNDRKQIPQKYFIENNWMFKVALYGNTLDFKLLKKIEKVSTGKIGDFIDNQITFKGAGIERGKKPKPFPDLIGLKIIENNEVKQHYTKIVTKKKLTEQDVNLGYGKDINIFLGEKILLRENALNESDLLISYVEETCVFRKGICSISSKDSDLIKFLYGILKSNLCTYFIYLTSVAWGIATRPAIRFDEEYLGFPLYEPSKNVRKKLINLVNQFFKYSKERNGDEFNEPKDITNEINNIIYELYEIKEYEKDLIDYVLNVSRYQFQESKQHLFTRKVHQDEQLLESYADIFLDEFQKIYHDEYIQVEIYPLNHFIAMNFVFYKDKPTNYQKIVFPSEKTTEKEVLKCLAKNLTISKITDTKDPSKNLYIQKDIKGSEKNSLYIIKPNEYKCWHRAMAWYDVAEFMENIELAELDHLNSTASESF